MAGDEFCFIHAADLHLDTPFVGLGQVAPAVADVLREASLRTFDAIVDLARRREAAFAVFAGDIYDGAARGLRAQLRFRDGLARLGAAGIASFVVHGNHDPLREGWSAIKEWPAGVTVFGTGDPVVVPLARAGVVVATVQGVSYAEAATTENLARRFTRPTGPGVHIGLLHCNVEGAAGDHANYSPCSLADLRATRLDYLALGHVHAHAVLAAGSGPGDPWVVYPGTPQARSARGGELGEKGALVVHVAEGQVRDVEFVACDTVRFEVATADIEEHDDVGTLLEELDADARGRLAAAAGRSLVLRAELIGRGELHGLISRPGARDELLSALRDRTATAEPFVWWADIVDRTATVVDRAATRARGDFAADLIAVAEELVASGPGIDQLFNDLGGLPRALLPTFRGVASGENGVAALLERATDLALGALAAEET